MEEQEQKILNFMNDEDYVPMKAKEIAMLMKVPKNEYHEFLEIIGKLELEMKIQKNRKNRYRLSDKHIMKDILEKMLEGMDLLELKDKKTKYLYLKKIH